MVRSDPVWGLIGLFAVIAFLVGISFVSRRKAKEERGLSPAFQTICAGRVGLFWTAIPAIRFSIYQRFFVVAYHSPAVIPFNQLAGTSVRWTIVGRCIRVDVKDGRSYSLKVKEPDHIRKMLARLSVE